MIIRLEAHHPKDVGIRSAIVLLRDIPGYEKFQSYMILPSGQLCSGKGGKYKKIKPTTGGYSISYQQEFMPFHQEFLKPIDVATLYRKYKDELEIHRLEVH